MKTLWLLMVFGTLIWSRAPAQTTLDKSRVTNFKEFCKYLKLSDTIQLDTSVILEKYVSVQIVKPALTNEINEKRVILFRNLCKGLLKSIEALDLNQFDAVPIHLYHQKNVADINDVHSHENDIYVYYLNTMPEVPLGYLYFAPGSKKVLSWLLINESGTIYFFTLN